MQHDHYSKEKYSKNFCISYFLLTAFSVSIIVLGPFFNCGSRSNQNKKSWHYTKQNPRFFFTWRSFRTRQEPGTQEAIILSKFLFLRFYCYPFLSLTSSLNYHLYFDVKPITLKNPPGQGFVPNQIIPRFFLFKFFCIIRREPNPSHILTHQKSPSHRSR